MHLLLRFLTMTLRENQIELQWSERIRDEMMRANPRLRSV